MLEEKTKELGYKVGACLLPGLLSEPQAPPLQSRAARPRPRSLVEQQAPACASSFQGLAGPRRGLRRAGGFPAPPTHRLGLLRPGTWVLPLGGLARAVGTPGQASRAALPATCGGFGVPRVHMWAARPETSPAHVETTLGPQEMGSTPRQQQAQATALTCDCQAALHSALRLTANLGAIPALKCEGPSSREPGL